MILWLDLRLKETQSQIIIVSGTHSGAQNTDAVIPDWLRNNAAGGQMIKLMIIHSQME